MLNRAYLVASYFPELKVTGESAAEDVQLMKAALTAFASGSEIYAGHAGTVLRFMALRASRQPGRHTIRGERRLFARPQTELLKILRQVGVTAELGEDFLRLESAGWKMQGDTLLIPSDRSSQFASSVLLNAWDLPFDLYVSLGAGRVSEGYWRMSVQMAQNLGMKIDFWDSDFRIPRGQKILGKEIGAEIDMSSAFALAAIAAVGGQATLLDFPQTSLQPDSVFVSILQRMGVPLRLEAGSLKVQRASRLNGVAVNLRSAPDLFPVLAILCALAEGESDLYGAPQLVHKESDRIQRIAEWITKAGRPVVIKEDGLLIRGSEPIRPDAALTLHTDQDHRLAFAAAVLKGAGFPVQIEHPEVVRKSFPEFWSLLGWNV